MSNLTEEACKAVDSTNIRGALEHLDKLVTQEPYKNAKTAFDAALVQARQDHTALERKDIFLDGNTAVKLIDSGVIPNDLIKHISGGMNADDLRKGIDEGNPLYLKTFNEGMDGFNPTRLKGRDAEEICEEHLQDTSRIPDARTTDTEPTRDR